MNRTRLLTITIAVALVAATCGGEDDGTSPLTLAEYTAELQAIEAEFQVDAADDPDSRGPYPIGGDLVAATELYMAYDERLASWQALAPPTEVGDAHTRFVDALATFKKELGDYLMDEALEADDFDFGAIAPKVASYIEAAVAACRDLESALVNAGAEIEFEDNCTF